MASTLFANLPVGLMRSKLFARVFKPYKRTGLVIDVMPRSGKHKPNDGRTIGEVVVSDTAVHVETESPRWAKSSRGRK